MQQLREFGEELPNVEELGELRDISFGDFGEVLKTFRPNMNKARQLRYRRRYEEFVNKG